MMKRVVNRGKITAQTGPLAFIGGGAMTEAIIKGILGAGLADPGEIFVGEPSAARCEYLQKTYGIKASGDNKAVVKDAGLIILAVNRRLLMRRSLLSLLQQCRRRQRCFRSWAVSIWRSCIR